MTSRKVFAVMAALGILAISSVAGAGIVDPVNSFATMANSPAVITVAPGGYDGLLIPEDHTIDVYLNDAGGNPVEVISTDIWLQHDDVVWCPGNFIADSSTYGPDAGHTTFTGTPRGGTATGADCGAIQMNVIAVGFVIETLDLGVNSFDLNGDGHVAAADFGSFAGMYLTTNACGDYNGDGSVSAADFGMYAPVHNNSDCP